MRRIAPLVALVVGLVLGWVAREPELAVPEVVVRWVRGPVRTREVAVERANPPTEECLAQDRVAIALLGLPDDVPLAPPATESACRARVELAAALTTARQLDELGRPRPFPDDLPAKYREAEFGRVAREVARECPHLDLRRVDCSELPCLALFVRASGSAGAASCAPWREAYGDQQTTSSGLLVGPDGERIAYELVGASIPKEILPPEPAPAPMPGGGMAWDNGTKRLHARGQEARDEVAADFGARELTEAEQREDQRRFFQELADRGDEQAAKVLERMEDHWAEEDATP